MTGLTGFEMAKNSKMESYNPFNPVKNERVVIIKNG